MLMVKVIAYVEPSQKENGEKLLKSNGYESQTINSVETKESLVIRLQQTLFRNCCRNTYIFGICAITYEPLARGSKLGQMFNC